MWPVILSNYITFQRVHIYLFLNIGYIWKINNARIFNYDVILSTQIMHDWQETLDFINQIEKLAEFLDKFHYHNLIDVNSWRVHNKDISWSANENWIIAIELYSVYIYVTVMKSFFKETFVTFFIV